MVSIYYEFSLSFNMLVKFFLFKSVVRCRDLILNIPVICQFSSKVNSICTSYMQCMKYIVTLYIVC